jgi:hypothetical protein
LVKELTKRESRKQVKIRMPFGEETKGGSGAKESGPQTQGLE